MAGGVQGADAPAAVPERGGLVAHQQQLAGDRGLGLELLGDLH